MTSEAPARAEAPVLVVFARAPIAGEVKTRLAATVGPELAAAVYRDLVTATLRNAVDARTKGHLRAIELWCTPEPGIPYFQSLAGEFELTLHRQCAGDLGTRMAAALADVLSRCPQALLIGTDCPVLGAAELAGAAGALATRDAVLCPAEDGGFVLVGTRVVLSFDDVRWSCPRTLADTRAAFTRCGIDWAELPALWDVDEPADLARWHALRDGGNSV